MIKFEGKVNNLVRNYLLIKFFFIGTIGGIVAVVFYALISGFVFISAENQWFLIILAVIYLLVIVLFCWTINGALPKYIEVEQDSISGTTKDGGYATRKVEHIKKIIDYGDFYVVKFYFPEHWINCICQKDLIVEGTIEQFEEMFKDKIIRKIKNK